MAVVVRLGSRKKVNYEDEKCYPEIAICSDKIFDTCVITDKLEGKHKMDLMKL